MLFFRTVGCVLLGGLPLAALATQHGSGPVDGPGSFAELVGGIVNIVDLITVILTGVAVLVFFTGLVQFILHAGDKTSVDAGKQKISAGLIGIFIIVAVWALVKIAATTFNLL